MQMRRPYEFKTATATGRKRLAVRVAVPGSGNGTIWDPGLSLAGREGEAFGRKRFHSDGKVKATLANSEARIRIQGELPDELSIQNGVLQRISLSGLCKHGVVLTDTCSETESPSTKHLRSSNMKEWGAKISARPSAQTISGPIENSIRKADGLLRSSEQEGVGQESLMKETRPKT
ncbi:hypothetical protein CDAR_589411 [Caerostris darwini]|uniref:Uncharacterized protein n=1 Tax=Caerostris darwini TaxID=1538125 RepID=A0AAV4T9T1_9ARAC|nr:hypothetical protein CDAR_589411 [Caerostris darwini]